MGSKPQIPDQRNTSEDELPAAAEDIPPAKEDDGAFYTAIIQSILTSCITIWYATVKDRSGLLRIISLPRGSSAAASHPSGPVGLQVPEACWDDGGDPSQPGLTLFEPLSSGRRLRSIKTKTSRHMNCFFPSAVGLVNNSGPH